MSPQMTEQIPAKPAISWLDALAEGTRTKLEPVLQYHEFANGAIVMREGEASDWVGVMLAGEAVVEKMIDRDASVVEIVAAISRGDVIGEMAFLEQKPRSATVRARGPVRIARLAREAFRELMRTDPDAAEALVGALLRTLSSRLRDSTEAFVALYSAGRQIGAAQNLDDVCAALLQESVKVVSAASAGVVATMDAANELGLRPIVSFGFPPTLPVPFPLDPLGPLFRSLLVRSAGSVIGVGDALSSEVAFFGARWCLVTELAHEGRVLGILALCSNADANPFLSSHEAIVAVLANQAGATVARYLAVEATRTMS
jgi:CRP/FNR family cyclic AMP-dependent transcriptional regulator